MYRITRAIPLIIMLALLTARVAAAQPYKDTSQPIETRVQDLLSRMTLEEKFWQLFMLAGSLEGGAERYRDGAFGFQIGAYCDNLDAAT
ncbi:MAG: hypothetical protein PHR28_14405, partial [candidate division Zixibacteria bacterium]|nr:hypothetical protein [candidate division Zixibacteria bacterium]